MAEFRKKLKAWGLDKMWRKSHTRGRELNDAGWSSGIIHTRDNPKMLMMCLLCGTCVQHGQNQDLMENSGCCMPCIHACICGCHCCELARSRRDKRVRLGIQGVWFVDCCLTCFCPCCTVCQETRELELRTKRIWHPIWGFRTYEDYHTSIYFSGKDPLMREICCGEERLNSTVPFNINNPSFEPEGDGLEGDDRPSTGGTNQEEKSLLKPSQQNSMSPT